jgi:hypothetical protein
MAKIGPKVTQQYFGQPIGNGQDPDEPNDSSSKRKDGWKISGKGAMGGGSKPTPQAALMKRGSGKLGSSIPRNSQKLRG